MDVEEKLRKVKEFWNEFLHITERLGGRELPRGGQRVERSVCYIKTLTLYGDWKVCTVKLVRGVYSEVGEGSVQ